MRKHRIGELNSETKHWKAAAPTWNYKENGARNNAQVHIFSTKLMGQGTGNSCQVIFLVSYFLKIDEEEILLLMFINANKLLNQVPVDCSETRDAFGSGNCVLERVL